MNKKLKTITASHTVHLAHIERQNPRGYKVFLAWTDGNFLNPWLEDDEIPRILLRGILTQFIYDKSIFMCEWFTKQLQFDLFFGDDQFDFASALNRFFENVGVEYGKTS